MVYIANLLYLMSYLSRDIVTLRVYTISAALCLITYFFNLPEPLLTVVAWNIFFVLLNIWQIARQYVHKSHIKSITHKPTFTAGNNWSLPKGSCWP